MLLKNKFKYVIFSILSRKIYKLFYMEVYIIGSGGNCKIIIDLCELLNYQIMGIFDDKFNGTEINIYKNNKIIGKIDSLKNYSNVNIINSIGDNDARFNIYKRLEDTKLN